MRYSFFLIVAILGIVMVSGCSAVRSSDSVNVALQADPSTVFSKSSTTIHMDIDNHQDKTVRNVFIELFDTGLLRNNGCSRAFDRLLPYEFQTVSCDLQAPAIIERTTTTQVNSRTTFDVDFSANQVFDIISEDEYRRQIATGEYKSKPNSYLYDDKNIMLEIDFSESLPLVFRTDKKYFVYFTLKNIGNGFVGEIPPGNFEVTSSNNIVKCPPPTTLAPNGKTFPRIACEIVAAPGYVGTGGLRNSDLLVDLTYTYELRNTLQVNLVQ